MKFQQWIYISASLAAHHTSAQSTNSTSRDYNFTCTSLVPSSPSSFNVTVPAATTIRVSRGAYCPVAGGPECVLTARGVVDVNSTINDTSIDADIMYSVLQHGLRAADFRLLEVRNLTTTSVGMKFEDEGRNFTVAPGGAGYVGFTPDMTCYEGTVRTVEQCAAQDERVERVRARFDGRGVRVCVPLWMKDRRWVERVGGTLRLVNVTREEAEREEMQVNPALRNSLEGAKPGVQEGNGTDSEVGGGGRVQVGSVGSVVAALGAVFAAGML